MLDELLGFWNVPMAVWIDEDGVLVRPPEGASVEDSPLRTMDISGFPDGIRQVMEEVQKIPGDPIAYRAAIVDWANNGAASRFALSPDEVIERSQPRPMEHARGGGLLRARSRAVAARAARRGRAVVARGASTASGELDLQAPGVDVRHNRTGSTARSAAATE